MRRIVEYIWIDAKQELRGKTKVLELDNEINSENDIPKWNFDGSSTGQASTEDSEVILRPVKIFTDPFREKNGMKNPKICLCECLSLSGAPLATNSRSKANEIFNKKLALKPWFGVEQEYVLFRNGAPLGWPISKSHSGLGPHTQIGFPAQQGPYYCAVGSDVSSGREIAEEHFAACLAAGVKISGLNSEVMLGQWEFQVGPCIGISSGDNMYVARYLLLRVCERHGVTVSFEPKPIPGGWNGSGAHINFSTLPMREAGGYNKAIKPAIEKMENRHKEHIAVYGNGNDQRLTGSCETSSVYKFSWGVGNRNASVRVPNETEQKGCGYLEDRRPSANIDPYLVTSKIFETCCL